MQNETIQLDSNLKMLKLLLCVTTVWETGTMYTIELIAITCRSYI